MPRSAYMICSTSGSADIFTGAISCFNILDIIAVNKLKPEEKPSTFRMRVISAWMHEETDELAKKYEGELLVVFDAEAIPVGKFQDFIFEGPYHRMVWPELLFQGFPKLGPMIVQCRIREIGTEAWHTQSFPLLIQEKEQDASLIQEKELHQPDKP